MTVVEIYLLGVLIAFVLELFVALRIRQISISTFLLPVLFHWVLLIAFMFWVYDILGLRYQDLTRPNIVLWRVKRGK